MRSAAAVSSGRRALQPTSSWWCCARWPWWRSARTAVSQLLVVRRDRASLPRRAEVLGRIEGKATDPAEPTYARAPIPGQVGLGGVLDDPGAMVSGDAGKRVHVGWVAVQVHCDDAGGAALHAAHAPPPRPTGCA